MTLQLANYSHSTSNPICRAATGHLVDLAGSADGRAVIDLACGTGACSLCLLERYSIGELILVDPDRGALLYAQESCSIPSRTFCTSPSNCLA
jgi:ubiquinone/menaquinone biosynthesis C-methylase UbiE